MNPKGKLKFNDYVKEYYRELWATCEVDPAKTYVIDRYVIDNIIVNIDRYNKVSDLTGVPWFMVAAIHYKECSGDFSKGLHNGQPWNRRTTIVPIGKGPFNSWEEAAVDALEDKVNWLLDIIGGYNVEGILYFLERYNGPGYYHRGINTPYLWAFTNHYHKGLFVSDGRFDSEAVSKSPGCCAIFKRLIDLNIIDESEIDDTGEYSMENYLKAEVLISESKVRELYEKLPKKEEPAKPEPIVTMPNIYTRNEKCLRVAASFIGVYEWTEPGKSNPVIEQWLDMGSSKSNKDSGLTDDIPHCAAFVSAVLEYDKDAKGVPMKPVMESTNSLMARSYEKWGISVLHNTDLSPLPGDIWIKHRNGLASGFGHTGFVVRFTDSYTWVLGANQNDECNITRYSNQTMTDVRRSSKAGQYSEEQIERLYRLANDLLAGVPINNEGSVI